MEQSFRGWSDVRTRGFLVIKLDEISTFKVSSESFLPSALFPYLESRDEILLRGEGCDTPCHENPKSHDQAVIQILILEQDQVKQI